MVSEMENSLDDILVEVGEFGKYQYITFGLVCLAVIVHSGVHVAYVFTAMDLPYRCEVPGCDINDHKPEYAPKWLKNAVPFSDATKSPMKCSKFTLATNNLTNPEQCYSNSTFNRDHWTNCDGRYVYGGLENTILKEYNLQCDENLWKLTLVGTINNAGQFFGLFAAGIFSDRYGRKLCLIFGLILCGVAGLIRTLAPTYVWFLVWEFLDAFFGAGTYACGFIVGVELVGPAKRVLMGSCIASCYAIGEIFTASSFWLTKDWRHLIYIIYGPSLALILYFWLIPESVRWHLSKGYVDEAKATLQKVARCNGRTLSESSLEKLTLIGKEEAKKNRHKNSGEYLEKGGNLSVLDVFKSTRLVCRLINCCFCWITCAFLFYGLTLNSVALAGNPYLDFILTSLVEMPATFFCAFSMNRFGRRLNLAGAFFITCISCIGFLVTPKEGGGAVVHYASLSIYLIGKFGATVAFTATYIITSELFPTPLRHSIMGMCSMFGRIGSMVSPQSPLLAMIWSPLPLVTYASMACLAGCLTLLFPETRSIKLPDTIEEAIKIGESASSFDTVIKVDCRASVMYRGNSSDDKKLNKTISIIGDNNE